MVKRTKKPQAITNNPQNSPHLTPKLDSKLSKKSTPKKSRQQIYSENYQKNKEKKKRQQQERYQQNKERIKAQKKINYAKKKQQAQLETQQQSAKYYQAEAIKILMTFKEYTELNKEKKKLWQDFNWTFQDCQKSFSEGYADVVMIMKLAQVADNLIRDYRETAKSEEKKRGKNWNSLDYDQQQRVIRYWGYEKARTENNLLTTDEQLEKQSQEYLKEIERAKFHEERGKIKCPCYQCQESKKIRSEIKEQLFKGEKEQKAIMIEGECSNCYEYKKVDNESGLCRKCGKE